MSDPVEMALEEFLLQLITRVLEAAAGASEIQRVCVLAQLENMEGDAAAASKSLQEAIQLLRTNSVALKGAIEFASQYATARLQNMVGPDGSSE